MVPTSSVSGPLCSPLRAWYSAPLNQFHCTDSTAILGTLAENGKYDLLTSQRDTWVTEIELLKEYLTGIEGLIFLEFTIPRMGRRIDVVLLIEYLVFALEFKVGEEDFDRAAREQVWDYALDLKNFHESSHHASIVPILVVTEASQSPELVFHADKDRVYRPVSCKSSDLRRVIDAARQHISRPAFDVQSWANAPYHPTPSIVEAARSLYARHSVESITRSDAGAKNLTITSARIEELVDAARAKRQKIICFVTGVPGAGKTLVGLNLATRHRRQDEPTHAVFLSGNGPLVAVLREALTRDEVERTKAKGEKIRKKEVAERVKAFIQNVHHFRDEAIRDPAPPIEHVVIFDEAQRAWNLRQTQKFMKQKRDHEDFDQSEPEFLISCMDRHQDWAAIVCLVGGGQEINTGEAGIGAWLDAIDRSFPDWVVYVSEQLSDSEYRADDTLRQLGNRSSIHFDESLHLAVSMRSFRAENVSAFVKALLDCDLDDAREAYSKLSKKYPIIATRDLSAAKQWVRERARGSERYGLVASYKAQRLKPDAIDIRVEVDPVNWFLNDSDDTRSSYYLEDAATEFQVQGLELDWTCLTWDGDFRFNNGDWSCHDFRGKKWTNIASAENRNYLRNAYRVLLTRARQGMIIYVPKGEPKDPTRLSDYYDPTFLYLKDLGIPTLHPGE